MKFDDDQRSGIRINVKGFAMPKPEAAAVNPLQHPLVGRRTLMGVLLLGLCLGLATTALVRSSNGAAATRDPFRKASARQCPQPATAAAAPDC